MIRSLIRDLEAVGQSGSQPRHRAKGHQEYAQILANSQAPDCPEKFPNCFSFR